MGRVHVVDRRGIFPTAAPGLLAVCWRALQEISPVQLEQLYGDVDNSLRMTGAGLWHGTPLDVLTAAVPLMEKHVSIGPGFNVLDAGAGDGRVLAALALGLSSPSGVNLLGLELDAALLEDARTRLARLPSGSTVNVAPGSFLELDPLTQLGVRVNQLDLVLNYPDGNEHALAAFLSKHASPSCVLAILSPETHPEVGFPAVERVVVAPQSRHETWSLNLFRPAA